jgi:hypothetical protein
MVNPGVLEAAIEMEGGEVVGPIGAAIEEFLTIGALTVEVDRESGVTAGRPVDGPLRFGGAASAVDQKHGGESGFEEVIGAGVIGEGAAGFVEVGLGGEVEFGDGDGAVGAAAGLRIAEGMVAGTVEGREVEGDGGRRGQRELQSVWAKGIGPELVVEDVVGIERNNLIANCQCDPIVALAQLFNRTNDQSSLHVRKGAASSDDSTLGFIF